MIEVNADIISILIHNRIKFYIWKNLLFLKMFNADEFCGMM